MHFSQEAMPGMTENFADITAGESRQIGQLTASYRVSIAFEFFGNAYKVNNLARAWQLVKEAQNIVIGLVLDTFHFFLGNSRIEDLSAMPVAN